MAGLKTTFAVLAPEFTLAPAAAIGAIYCATEYTPKQTAWLEKIVSEHIVEPHLKWFESLGGRLKKARDNYDEKKREWAVKRGEPIKENSVSKASPKERADVIADVLVKGTIAMTADFLATLGGQKVVSHVLKVPPLKSWIAGAGSVTHIAGIAAMAGPAATTGENIHYRIAKTLHNKFGIDKEAADDIGIAVPYIVLPGIVGSLVSLVLAHGALNSHAR